MKKNQDGMIVIFVVVMIGIISILYASIYVLIGIENSIHNSLEYRTKAYYVAESGLERGVALVKQDRTSSFQCDNPFSTSYSEQHSYNVQIAAEGVNTYTVTSTGRYANTTRIVEAKIYKNGSDFQIQSWKEVN